MTIREIFRGAERPFCIGGMICGTFWLHDLNVTFFWSMLLLCCETRRAIKSRD